MRRILRSLLPVVMLALLAGCSQSEQKAEYWQEYKKHFLSADGAIIDAVNGGIRHSEGQGMGMLLATTYEDRETFERIWKWSQDNLQVRSWDKLLAWRWQEQEPHVSDRNNASDGDILVAWALLRAHRLWQQQEHLDAAKAMMADIRKNLLISFDGRLLLLPGADGFVKDEGTIINPSYWVFPALVDFAALDPNEPMWPGLIQSGRRLLDEARYGPWKLPSDWLMVYHGGVKPADQFPKRFGLDAVRIPLYLYWGGYSDHSAVASANRFWSVFTGVSAWPDWCQLDDTIVHLGDALKGVEAIAAVARPPAIDEEMRPIPKLDWERAEYYQATLLLISLAARGEKMR